MLVIPRGIPFVSRRRRYAPVGTSALVISLFAIPTRLAVGQVAAASQPTLTLRALLDSVRVNHPVVQAATSRTRAAEASRLTARTLGNPVLSYQVDQTPVSGGHALQQSMEREAMTTATFPLEFLYQRRSRVARASAEVRAAEADASATRQRVGLDAAAVYYRTALAQVQVATTHDLLRWLDTLVVYNRARVEEGVAAEADLIRSQLERDRVAAEASMQEAELAQARAALASFVSDSETMRLGSPVASIEEAPLPLPAATPVTSRAPTPAAGAAPALSVAERPDVRAARERLAASAAAVASERTMVLRQLGATVGTMQVGQTTSMIAGVSFPVPVFDQNRGEIRRANAERDAAAFEVAAQERSAMAELRGAYEAALILTERVQRLARRDSMTFLDRAEESRRIALGAYREGAVPLFQVIDAARAWVDARMTYYRTMAAQHQSVLVLIVAQGLDLFTSLPSSASPGGLHQ
jgi:cobalt-zinc-cadmium efflux system outer membrane protein